MPRGLGWLVGLGLLILLGLGGRSCYQAGQRASQWEDSVKVLLAHDQTVLKQNTADSLRVDSLLRVVAAKDAASARQAQRAHQGRQHADSLAQASPDSFTVPRAAYEALGQAFDSLDAALRSQLEVSAGLRLALGVSESRADSVAAALRATMAILDARPRPCRILGLVACPSRGAVFLVGVAAGAGVTLLH